MLWTSLYDSLVLSKTAKIRICIQTKIGLVHYLSYGYLIDLHVGQTKLTRISSYVNIILPRTDDPLGLEFAVLGLEAEAVSASKRSFVEALPTREDTEVMGGEGSSTFLVTVSHPEKYDFSTASVNK